MAEPLRVMISGSTMRIVMDDDTVRNARPTPTQTWIVINDSSTGPVDPQPGNGQFKVPFAFSTVEAVGEYGPRFGRFHEGIDFPGAGVGGAGTPIKVSGNGVVQENYEHPAFGNLLIVNHGIITTGSLAGKRVRSLYAHMIAPSPLAVGSATVAGVTVAGGVGNTGSASQGAHLHHEIHITDPNNGIVWNTSDNGGYRSAMSPRTFYGEYGG
ncbi:endolysin protease M23 domain [Microbacterium phage Curie]